MQRVFSLAAVACAICSPTNAQVQPCREVSEDEQKPPHLHFPNQNLVEVFEQLAKVMKDTNNSSDTTEPTHFNGSDSKWDEFYSQLRTYLSAKDWLTTFEHLSDLGFQASAME